MNIDELQARRETDAMVAEKVMGWRWFTLPGKRSVMFSPESYTSEWFMEYPFEEGRQKDVDQDMTNHPHYSIDIANAMEIDRDGWYWQFEEEQQGLLVTLYTSRQVLIEKACQYPAIPEGSFQSFVSWNEVETKAAAYALGRCRAALKAVNDET